MEHVNQDWLADAIAGNVARFHRLSFRLQTKDLSRLHEQTLDSHAHW